MIVFSKGFKPISFGIYCDIKNCLTASGLFFSKLFMFAIDSTISGLDVIELKIGVNKGFIIFSVIPKSPLINSVIPGGATTLKLPSIKLGLEIIGTKRGCPLEGVLAEK